MLRKHINDAPARVQIGDEATIGPCECPQPGCHGGYVTYIETGSGSGNYESRALCKCCDGKGRLYNNERPYAAHCRATGKRELHTEYPAPIPMPRAVYESPEIKRRAEEPTWQPEPPEYPGGGSGKNGGGIGFIGWLVLAVIGFLLLRSCG